jgi:hypothetical protein
MTYETMDWDAEARRIAQAFGIDKPCYWKQELSVWADDEAPAGAVPKTETEMWLKLQGSQYDNIELGEDQFLYCVYNNEERFFQTYDKKAKKGSPLYQMIEISIRWDGTHHVSEITSKKPLNLARGLFHLGYLTLPVEASLSLTISEHQKLEWTLENETRYKNERS